MDMTGMKFDLNPETFTLQNMFAMELHNFSDVIADITASATKELGIEKGISEVNETWSNMKFSVTKYMKGTQERGFVLGAVDEILQILDDNAMNLQSMSASRFVGPFLENVNKWEKSLSHIGEVVEVGIITMRMEGKRREGKGSHSGISNEFVSMFMCSSGMDGSPAKVDVLGEHLHWWRHQSTTS